MGHGGKKIMARKARELSPIDSYSVVFKSAPDTTFSSNDIKTFLYALNYFKQDNNYQVLAYHLQSKAFYLVLADIKIGIDVFLRKLSVSFAKKYNALHVRHGDVFGGRAITTPAKTYDQVYTMICDTHNISKIIPSEYSSAKDYFDNPNVDYGYILQRFDTADNFNNFCNKYNAYSIEAFQHKLSDEELSKYIYDTFNVTMLDMKDMSKGIIASIVSQIVKITKASARQISRVTSLPLRYLWNLMKTNKESKVSKDNEKQKQS